jgi:hypothetical protein
MPPPLPGPLIVTFAPSSSRIVQPLAAPRSGLPHVLGHVVVVVPVEVVVVVLAAT